MYGTVARLKVKPGEDEQLIKADLDTSVPGFVAAYGLRSDEDPDVYWVVALFESKEAYIANAHSPGQDARYRRMRELLAEDPEWHDGEVVVEGKAS